ncbi:MAG: hypothetical protein J1E41_01665 [Ruminococcus sp.]|nr:hypothetical protein [Ruminococcus sp.]
MNIKNICRPCAEKLKTDKKALSILNSQRDKETCVCCNRRRFVYMVDVKPFSKIKGVYS